MNIKYPLLLPTIGHGSTDLILNPPVTLLTHLFCLTFVKFIPEIPKKLLLLTSSIYHISKDIKFIPSFLLHSIWLKYPICSKLYLSFYHTPLHYKKCYQDNNKKIFKYQISTALLTTIFIQYSLNKNYDKYIQNKLGTYWWIAPVIGHIFVNEYLKLQKHLIKEQNLAKLLKVIVKV